MPTSIVFLGAKPIGYDCLQYLIDQQQTRNLQVLAVRSRPPKASDGGKDLYRLAREHSIPLLDTLDEIPECDLIYSVQHHELLAARHLRRAQKIAVNLHLAPLPEYRGCNQFSFAIIDEASEFGVSIHEIDTRIDHGDLLFESRFPVPEECWVAELHQRTVVEGLALFKNTLPDLIAGRYRRIPQETLIAQRGGALHFRSEINALKEIDLNAPASEIEKRIRATSMPGFDPPFCRIGGKKVIFQRHR